MKIEAALNPPLEALRTLDAPLPEVHQVTTENGVLEFATEEEGPPLLAIHGAMGGFDQSLLLARALGLEGHQRLAVSRPGYLGTPLSMGASYREQACALVELLDALGLDQALVAAISGGGPAAIELARRFPERCRGLILVSTTGSPLESPIPFAFHIMTFLAKRRWFARMVAKKGAANIEKSAGRSIPDPSLRKKTLEHPIAGPLFKALLMSTTQAMDARIAGTKNDIAKTRTYLAALEEVQAPTLVIHGEEDEIVPFAHGQKLAEEIPGAQSLFLKGGAHVSLFTHLDEIQEQVRRFL